MNNEDAFYAGIVHARGRLQTNQGGTRRPYRPMVTVHCAGRRIAQALRNHFDLGNIDSFRPVSNPHLEGVVCSVKGDGAMDVLDSRQRARKLRRRAAFRAEGIRVTPRILAFF